MECSVNGLVHAFLVSKDKKIAKKFARFCEKNNLELLINEQISLHDIFEFWKTNKKEIVDSEVEARVEVEILHKRKANDSTLAPESPSSPKRLRQASPPKRFQRVDPTKVEFVDERLKDNQFLSKGGAAENSYGFKAHKDLIVTKGKGFRAEKTKKKRGSYRGGQIDFQSHSIKFEE